ncbi:type IV toxin-antitoxin system AbiEi family antitoxin domain-containing protein [Sphingomonas sp. TX0543]|uniref:type IV toxin-antitoxin system AbiEi family antitoxin domain-containing protein n=1 Tax=Sphingomonas sp. TX0543 TaxID=3399682 RepID=UPI003AFA3D91
MSSLAQQISAAGLADHILSERQLGDLLGGGDARRYGLVNRALKDGSLLRVKRGTYVLGKRYRSATVHPFAVAQGLVPGSYVSFESALAHHGWIPEAVFETASVSPRRKTFRFETPDFGGFSFHPLAIKDYQFLTGVDRIVMGKLTAFVAQPLRALLDLVALRKEQWAGTEWLTRGMRIDDEMLFGLRRKDFAKLRPVYKHKAVNGFLASLESVVMAARKERSADD